MPKVKLVGVMVASVGSHQRSVARAAPTCMVGHVVGQVPETYHVVREEVMIAHTSLAHTHNNCTDACKGMMLGG